MSDALDYLKKTSEETLANHLRFMTEHADTLIEAARALGETIRQGGKVLIYGNGGSASDSQHMAAEMVGRMLVKRRSLAAIALTTDSSNLTAVGNDFGFDEVFDKQVQALADARDTVVAISTSGNSTNVLKATRTAREIGCRVIGLTGRTGGELRELCDYWLNVSSGTNSSRIHETHIFAIHSLVDLHDRFFLES